MGEMRRIELEIEIDAAMLAAADDAVDNGRSMDRDAVIAHALPLWSDDANPVRRMIDAGFASGDPLPGNFDAEDIKRRGRARLAERHGAWNRMDIIRRPSAQADVDDLWTHIATMDVAAADRTVDRIVAATERLRRFPRSGRERHEIHPGLRSIPAPPYVIFYRVAANGIARVIHGARDVPTLSGLD